MRFFKIGLTNFVLPIGAFIYFVCICMRHSLHHVYLNALQVWNCHLYGKYCNSAKRYQSVTQISKRRIFDRFYINANIAVTNVCAIKQPILRLIPETSVEVYTLHRESRPDRQDTEGVGVRTRCLQGVKYFFQGDDMCKVVLRQ